MKTYAITAAAGALFGLVLAPNRIVPSSAEEIGRTARNYCAFASLVAIPVLGIAKFTATKIGFDTAARYSSLALRGSLHSLTFTVIAHIAMSAIVNYRVNQGAQNTEFDLVSTRRR